MDTRSLFLLVPVLAIATAYVVSSPAQAGVPSTFAAPSSTGGAAAADRPWMCDAEYASEYRNHASALLASGSCGARGIKRDHTASGVRTLDCRDPEGRREGFSVIASNGGIVRVDEDVQGHAKRIVKYHPNGKPSVIRAFNVDDQTVACTRFYGADGAEQPGNHWGP